MIIEDITPLNTPGQYMIKCPPYSIRHVLPIEDTHLLRF